MLTKCSRTLIVQYENFTETTKIPRNGIALASFPLPVCILSQFACLIILCEHFATL